MSKGTWTKVGLLLAAGSLQFVLGCATTNQLGNYVFPDHTVSAVMSAPRRAEVFTNRGIWINRGDIVGSVLRAGTQIAVEEEARKVRDRMEVALAQVDIPATLKEQVLAEGADVLECRPVERLDRSDFFFDMEIRRYGIDAESPYERVQFVMDIRVSLRDTDTGRRIWTAWVNEREGVSPAIFGLGEVTGNVVSIVTLSELTEEQIARGVTRLADDAAARVVDRLQRDYLESRY
jgi:hypothetical protein